jgi:hypothetical protein
MAGTLDNEASSRPCEVIHKANLRVMFGCDKTFAQARGRERSLTAQGGQWGQRMETLGTRHPGLPLHLRSPKHFSIRYEQQSKNGGDEASGKRE